MSFRDRVEGPGVNCCCHRYGLLYLRALEKRIWCCHDSTFQFLLQVPGRIAIAISLIFSQLTSHWGASSWYTLSKPYRQNFIKSFCKDFGFSAPNNRPKTPRILSILPVGQNFLDKLLILHIVNVITKLCRSAALSDSCLLLVIRISSACVRAVFKLPTGGKHPAKICPCRKSK